MAHKIKKGFLMLLAFMMIFFCQTAYAQDFAYTGVVQSYTIPTTGYYVLEVWGGEGGGWGSHSKAPGGYSKGYKYFTAGTVVYVCVGDRGYDGSVSPSGTGYNGGGYSQKLRKYAGGGATHIALASGTLRSLSSQKDKVLIVAGGAGSNGWWGVGTSSGGGLTAPDVGDSHSTTKTSDDTYYAMGGTQTGSGNTTKGNAGGFGYGGTGGDNGGGSGGGGWYGGRGASNAIYHVHGGGGSAYIGGVTNGSTSTGVNYAAGKAKIYPCTHSYSGWTQTAAATCTTAGSKYRTCKLCGYKNTQSIAALGHAEPSSWSQDANNHYKNCTRCSTRLKTEAHYDNNSDGVCDVCGRDIQAPTCARAIYVGDATGYYVYAYITDNKGINRVQFPTWTTVNGQDDIQSDWTTSTAAKGTSGSWTIDGKTYNYRCRVNITDHNNELVGYNTHIYAFDTTGNYSCVKELNNIDIDNIPPIIDRTTYIVDADGINCYVHAYDPETRTYGVDGLTVSLWNTNIGDHTTGKIISVTALQNYTINGETYNYYYRVNKSDFNDYTTGYYSDARITDKSKNHLDVWDGTGSAMVVLADVALTTTITFDDNGGSGGPGTVVWIIGTENRPITPVRTGYVFDKWNKVQDGSGAWWPTDDIVTVDMTEYYAQWNPHRYEVIFDPNTGTATELTRTTATLADGQTLNDTFKTLSGSLSNIRCIKAVSSMPAGNAAVEIQAADSANKIYAECAGDTILIYTTADEIYMNESAAGTLAGMTNLEDAGIVEMWNTSNTTDLSRFFYNNESLTSLDLSGWDTASATKMTELFYGCSSLTEIQVSDTWNNEGIGEYANGTDMFTGCTGLSGYDAANTDVTYANADTGYFTKGTDNFHPYVWQKATYGDTFNLQANAYTKTGYLFAGWAESPSGDVVYANNEEISNLTEKEKITFYAKWDNAQYEVAFHGNDEKAEGTMVNQGFQYDITQSLNLNEFTKTGYFFTNWNESADNTGKSYLDGENVLNLTENHGDIIPLYAQWEANPYTVHFDKNSDKAQGFMADQAFVYDTPQALSGNAFVRPGYTFDSWNRNADLTGDSYQDKEEVMNLTTVKDDVVNLYVNWKANQYTVQFDPNGAEGSMEPMTFTYDAEQQLTANTFTRIGYSFNGWNTMPNGSGDSYSDGVKVMNLTTEEDGVVTLYAQWRPHGYVLQFYGNESTSGQMENQIVKYGTSVNIYKNAYVKTGYTFGHWSAVINGTTRTFVDEELITNLTPVDGTVYTFRAQWIPNGYLIVYDKNSVTAAGTMNNQAMTYDDPANLQNNTFTNYGYIFDSWNTEADGSGTKYENEAEVKNLCEGSGNTITLYAQWTPITYTLAFDGNGGTGEMTPITLTYDQAQDLPKVVFTKTGYPFTAWNTKKDGTGTSFADEASVLNLAGTQDAVVTLYAQWDAAVYYLNFHKNAEDALGTMDKQPLTYDVAQQLSKNTFTKSGYTFEKWTEQADGSGKSYLDQATVKNLTTEAEAELDLYAQWIANLYYVDFDKNDPDAEGSMSRQQFTFDASQFLKQNAFTKTGYTFNGWNTKPDGTGLNYSNKQAVKNLTTESNGVVTLYAQWTENHYTIAFNKNAANAEGSMLAQPFNYDEAQTLRANAFTRTGYQFGGWTTNPDGSGTTYQDQALVKNLTPEPYGIINLYAKWIPNHYYIKFNANVTPYTGSMERQEFTYDVAQKLTINGFESGGYLFNGWNTKPDGSGVSYFDEQEILNLTASDNEIINLYAQWLAGACYIIFDGNGSDGGAMGKQGTVYGVETTLNKNAFTKVGYHFTKWTTNADGTGSLYLDEETIVYESGNGDLTLYAQWEPNIYHISYNKNAANAEGTMEDDILNYGTSSVLQTNAFTRTGYTFTGWNTQADGKGTSYKENESVTNLTTENDGNITLYAQWRANTYQIEYNKNHAEATGATITTKTSYGETVLIPKCGFVRTGYSCSKWNTKPDGTGTEYKVGMEVSNLTTKDGDIITLYAQWEPITYKVVFNKNSSKATGVMETQAIKYDETVTLTENAFSYTGYAFESWNTAEDGTGTRYENQGEVKNLSADGSSITLYAQWKPISYILRFHANDASATGAMEDQTVVYDTDSTIVSNEFVKTGYMFINWSTEPNGNGTVYANNAAIKNLASAEETVIDLYAQWGTIRYFVAFDANAETATGTMSTVTYSYDQTQRLPANAFARVGYTFAGWNREADGSGAGYADKAQVLNLAEDVDSTVTLYAQWKPNVYTITFDKNSDEATGTMQDQAIPYDSAVKFTKNAYERTGYVFDSWNIKADGSGVKYTDEQEVKNLAVNEGSNLHLYAQWKPITYFVVFDSGAFNATGSMERQEITYDISTALSANKFVRSGYLFDGWSLNPDGTGDKFRNMETVLNLCTKQDDTITLYATWGHVNYYFEFNGNGATSGTMTRQTVVYGDSDTLDKNTFIRAGYEFINWNTKPDGSGTSYEDEQGIYNETDTGEAIINLYAQWEPTDCTITYELNGGSWATGYQPVTSKQYDVSVHLPGSTSVTRDGYMFIGWYTNSSCTGTAVTDLGSGVGDTTLYARWYDLNRNSGISNPVIHDFSTQ